MNAKQAAPLAVTLAPLIAAAPGLLILGGLVVLAAWIFSDDDKKKQSETTPTTAAPENPPLRVPPVSGWNVVEKHTVPPNSTVKPSVPPAPSVRVSVAAPIVSAPATPKIPVPNPAPIIPAIKTASVIPLPAQKKFIIREDMAKIFNRGARALTRKDAVAALTGLGFGKTAAYEALSPDGRFAFLLQFAPDGIITWKS